MTEAIEIVDLREQQKVLTHAQIEEIEEIKVQKLEASQVLFAIEVRSVWFFSSDFFQCFPTMCKCW